MRQKIRPVDLGDRVLLIGTERGIEPPIAVRKACLKALDRQYYDTLDKAIFEALGVQEKACLKSRGAGQGKPPPR